MWGRGRHDLDVARICRLLQARLRYDRIVKWLAVFVLGCGHPAAMDDQEDAPAPPRDATVDAPVYPPVAISGTAGRDEDPTLLRTADARITLAWFSERDGDDGNIYLRRSLDGLAWDPPVQVTSGPDADFYPNLLEAGVIHAVWMRRTGGKNGPGHIAYTTSPDGVTWTAAEQPLTPAGDDWTPSIAATPTGTLVVAFVRNACGATPCFAIMITTSANGGTSWSAPVPFGLAANGLADHLPIIARTGDHLTMVWNRYTSTPGHELPYLTNTSEVMMSTSTDGTAWTPAVALTANTDPDLFPWLYVDDPGPTGRWFATWLTAPSGGTPVTVEQPVDAIAPTGMIPTNGYSPRAIATGVAHRYVAAWVEGSDPDQDIVARAFSK
jgi:hypothetical protein